MHTRTLKNQLPTPPLRSTPAIPYTPGTSTCDDRAERSGAGAESGAANFLDKSTYSTSVRNGADPERTTLLPKASTPPMQAPLMATGSLDPFVDAK